jgi:hypothetical protein
VHQIVEGGATLNRITKASTMVSIETSNGFASRAGSNNKRGVTALLWALDELGRVMTIDGRADEARATLDKAIERTQRDLNGHSDAGAESVGSNNQE